MWNVSRAGEDRRRRPRRASVSARAGGVEHARRRGVATSRSRTAREQRLPAREAAVDGGAGAAGLPGDVVEGGLGDARRGRCRRARRRASGRRPGRAAEQYGAEVHLSLRHCTPTDRLIVNVSRRHDQCSRSASTPPVWSSGRRRPASTCAGRDAAPGQGLRRRCRRGARRVDQVSAPGPGSSRSQRPGASISERIAAGEVLGGAVEVDAGAQPAGLGLPREVRVQEVGDERQRLGRLDRQQRQQPLGLGVEDLAQHRVLGHRPVRVREALARAARRGRARRARDRRAR